MNARNKKKSKAKQLFLQILSIWPFLLSHHPECEHFTGHTLNLGRVKLCIGCFIGYPVAYLGILLLYYLNLDSFIPYHFYLGIGIILLSTFFLSFTKLTKIKIIKIFQKILIGLGASFIFWWIWLGGSSNQVKLNTFLLVFGLIIGGLNIYHVYGFFKGCYKCDTPFSWGKCSGFAYVKNYESFFSSMDEFSKKLIQRRMKKDK